MFLFATEPLDAATIAMIELPAEELSDYRFVSVSEATDLLGPRVGRRLGTVLAGNAMSVSTSRTNSTQVIPAADQRLTGFVHQE